MPRGNKASVYICLPRRLIYKSMNLEKLYNLVARNKYGRGRRSKWLLQVMGKEH